MKKTLAVALALGTTLALGACSNAPSGQTADGKAQITFAYWGNNSESATIKAIIADFEKEHPEIVVEGNWIQADYEQKLQTSIAGGKAPTVSQISNTSLASFSSAYQSVDLDPDTYYSPNIAASMSVGGEYFAVPFAVKPKIMAVNTAVFEEQGVELPPKDTPLSVEEFGKLAQEVAFGSGRDRNYGSSGLWYYGFVVAMGGDFFNREGTKCTFDSPENVAAANFVIDGQAPDGFAPSRLDSEGQDQFDWLSIGRIAMQPDFAPWDISKLVALEDPAIQLYPAPGKGGPMEINGLGISTSATAEETEAAKTFVDFVSTDPGAQGMLTSEKASLGVPVVSAATEAFEAAAPDLDLDLFVKGVDQSVVGSSVPGFVQLTGNLVTEMNSRTGLGSGNEDPATVLAELNTSCQAQLDGKKK